MLDEKNKEIKSKRQAFQQVLNGRREMFYSLPLRRAQECEEGDKEHAKRVLNEWLELTEEEKHFEEELNAEGKATRCMTDEEQDKQLMSKTKKWWCIWTVIRLKERVNQMKENHKLALEAQDELYGELIAEAKPVREWFYSLPEEQQVAARVAMEWVGKQRESCIKFQNEILQMEQKQLVILHYMIKDFPASD